MDRYEIKGAILACAMIVFVVSFFVWAINKGEQEQFERGLQRAVIFEEDLKSLNLGEGDLELIYMDSSHRKYVYITENWRISKYYAHHEKTFGFFGGTPKYLADYTIERR